MTASKKPAFKIPTRADLKPVVRGQNITFQTSGGVLKLPLDIKTKVFKKVRDIEDQTEAFFDLLEALGDEKASAVIGEVGMTEFMVIVTCYFQEFAKFADEIGAQLPSSDILGDEPGE